MSNCSFTIPFSGVPDNIINKAKSAILSQGGTFSGDQVQGRFSIQFLGNISGSYSIDGSEMNIVIDSKPMLISCKQIESFMSNQLAK
jgi:hypothetical protein